MVDQARTGPLFAAPGSASFAEFGLGCADQRQLVAGEWRARTCARRPPPGRPLSSPSRLAAIKRGLVR